MGRSFVQWLLKILSKKILAKYKPQIIAITGSVGKTSTREATHAVLSGKFSVRQSMRSYNDAIGVPMTIIGMESPGRSITGWVDVFGTALRLLFTNERSYPEMLVVEMGADRPGDIKYLVEMCPPNVAVLTAISPSHYAYFKTMERLEQEKKSIFSTLGVDGLAVLNVDDERVRTARAKLPCQVFTYGMVDVAADFVGSDMQVQYDVQGNPKGIMCKLNYHGATVPLAIPGVLGKQHVYSVLAATAVGTYYGMHLIEIAAALSQYAGAPGRMHIIPGIKRSAIIDDTYNSSPRAAHAAVEALASIEIQQPGAQRYAVLGDMLELGPITEEAHAELGKLVAQRKIDFLITVGEAAKHIARGAQEAGMEDHRIAKFAESSSAGMFLQEKIKANDVVLVKGSQGVRMEKIVKEVMARPELASKQLVRQYGKWVQ